MEASYTAMHCKTSIRFSSYGRELVIGEAASGIRTSTTLAGDVLRLSRTQRTANLHGKWIYYFF